MAVIFVTGGAGFIGSNFVRQMVFKGHFIVNIDKLTYAGNTNSLQEIALAENYVFAKGNICDSYLVKALLEKYNPVWIVNFAAETHVDRSIEDPRSFIESNVVGTFELLESIRAYWKDLSIDKKETLRFLHVSTDEVYGSLGNEGFFTEDTPYSPNSPYSASKAASDHLVRAYHHTYGLPTLITNCSNNYGPYQFPEKLIPLMIQRALSGQDMTIYGNGENVRDWLYVLDHCRALHVVLEKGQVGETYNIGGNNEKKNLQVVQSICDLLDEMKPNLNGVSYREQIQFVKDRPGHDQRYAIDSRKIQTTLGWRPQESFESGLRKTIRWYLENQRWCDHANQKYCGNRLGLIK